MLEVLPTYANKRRYECTGPWNKENITYGRIEIAQLRLANPNVLIKQKPTTVLQNNE